MEKTGLEPATPALQKRCATNCATSPCHGLSGRGKQLRKYYFSRTTRMSEPDTFESGSQQRVVIFASHILGPFPHASPHGQDGAASLGLIRRPIAR